MVNHADSVIQVSGLEKTYKSGILRRRRVEALQGIDLTVPKGRIYGLLGPNGAGKTTLIKVLLGIVKKSAGQATVLGRPAGSLASRRNIGYLPENHRIPRHLTGNTALEYYGCLSGLSVSEVKQRRPELLNRVGLINRGGDNVSGYSKGMLQRLGLAQAMLHKPELIILDEPTDGVDPVGRKDIREILQELADDGHTIFLNSHLLQEIELICDQVAILMHGRVLKTGSVDDLTQSIEGAPIQMQLTGEESGIRTTLAGFENCQIRKVSDSAFEVELVASAQSVVDKAIDQLRANSISIWSLRRRQLTLEEAFLKAVEESHK